MERGQAEEFARGVAAYRRGEPLWPHNTPWWIEGFQEAEAIEERKMYGIIYVGTPRHTVEVITGRIVRRLNPRHDLRNHSPDGFCWGIFHAGAAQLALALCAHALGNDRRALRLYQRFKAKVIGTLDIDKGFTISLKSVVRTCEEIEAEMAEDERREQARAQAADNSVKGAA